MNNLIELNKLKNKYFALRHGESIANVEGIILSDPKNGVCSYGLTEKGLLQASTVAESYKYDVNDTIIITSDFLRAFETAEIFAKKTGCRNLQKEKNLRERSFGEFEKTSNLNYEKIWEKDKSDTDSSLKNCESVNSVLERTTAVIKKLESIYDKKNIIIVSHGDSLQILQTGFQKIDPRFHRQLRHLETAELRQLKLKENN